MTNGTPARPGTEPQTIKCPPWCVEQTHTPERNNGYFHDGEAVTLTPSPASLGLTVDPLSSGLHVKPSLFVPVPGEKPDRDYTPQVEIQTDHGAVVELCPRDARRLAVMLLEAADLADGADDA